MKLLGDLAKPDRFLKQGARLLAWIDEDKVHRDLKLPANSPRHVLVDQIKAKAILQRSHDGRVEVFLLQRNLEHLIAAVRDLPNENNPLTPELIALAIAGKQLDARDAIFDELAKSSPTSAKLREQLRRAHPGFSAVSHFVMCTLTQPQWPP